MKILKLLNKVYLSIVVISLFLGLNSHAEDQPVDIWNIDKKKIVITSSDNASVSINNSNNKTEHHFYVSNYTESFEKS